jgi:hypothetical protein
MKQAAIQKLYSYWDSLRGARPAPERREIEPSEIRELLGDTFILEFEGTDRFTFRLAGTRMCSAYCRELKGRNFADLWTGKDREAIVNIIAAITTDGAATVLGFQGRNQLGKTLDFELLLLPLRQSGEGFNRILGLCVPVDTPYWIGVHPIHEQSIISTRLIWPNQRPFFLRRQRRPETVDLDTIAPQPPAIVPHQPDVTSRRYGHLTVYDGGRG